MSNVEWTAEQKAALKHKSGGAIVSASAGSGKTAVLVERVLRLLISGQAQPSGLAVVTFTEKAAQELKYRLIIKLKEQISLNPQDAQLLRRRAAELHNARISTISSFCIRLLREYSDLTELSPGFAIMDENRADIMKGAVLDGLLEDFYADADQQTLDLVGEYFIRKDDRTLYELISKVYSFCVNMPDYEKWLDMCESGFPETLKKYIAEAAVDKAEEALTHFENMKELLPKQSEKQQKYFQKLQESKILAIMGLVQNGGIIFDKISELFSIKINRVNDCHPRFASERDKFLELSETAWSFAKMAETTDSDTERYQPVQELTVRLVREFISRYNAEKRAQNVADFADAEQELYHLLLNHPEVKKKIGLQYIIVDEFQDSNEIQYEIFKRLSDNEQNLYFVGDIKQSIYAFRGAQPEVFARICRDKRYTLYPLNANFRSRQNVIDGVNSIFDRVMTETFGGADYRNTSRLVCSRKDKYDFNDITEIVGVIPEEEDGDSHTAEAEYVAGRIRDMIDSGYKVKGRPCREGDFAVLMRSKDRADIFADAMKRRGLSCEISMGGGFFESPEIRYMTAFLTVLDDPYSDNELVTLMMSPIYGFSAEDMARIRTGTCGIKDISALRADCGDELARYTAAYSEKPLYSCLIDAAKRGFCPEKDSYPALYAAKESDKYGITDKPDKKCAALLAELKRLRGFMEGSTTSALIQKIYDSTNAKELLLICPDPDARAANLRMLLSLAKSSDEYGGLPSDFLKTLSDTAEHGAKINNELSPAESGVKLMTVHGSKGLQFPICFVSCCDKQFNNNDEKSQFILSTRYGISGKLIDRKHMLSRSTPAYVLAKQENAYRMFSEEIRLMYVAATRAEEKLIFTAAMGKRKFYSSYFGLLRAEAENDGISFPDKEPGSVLCFDQKVNYTLVRQNSHAEPYAAADALHPDRDTAERIAAQITTPYPAAPLSRMAAKYSATELVRNRRITRGSTEHCDLYISRPKFAEKSGRLTGKRRGDAYHKAMQYIPLDRVPTLDELTAQLDALVGILTEQERECIDPEDIIRFFDTEQARRMINSENIYREQPIFFKADVSKLSAKELGISERDREEYLALAGADAPYIQGIADAFFIEDGEIVLIDYKSDSFSDEEKLSEDYSFQLRLYAAALKRMYGMNVKESYIYSFRLGKMISVDMEENE